MSTSAGRPLDGVRVLDLSRVLAGPYCAMSLADMGADVIKVERPGAGDDTRGFGPPFVGGVSTYFLSINRGKRSITVDLKHPEGKALLWRLVEWSDVLLENFRPGALARLGFDYDACRARNERLIYCSISAFGHHGDPAWSSRPGYDVIVQGMGGIPSLTGPVDGAPYKVGASIADIVAGMNATQGVLLALLARQRTGRGQHVDCAMFDGQLSLLTYLGGAWLNADVAPTRRGNRHPSIAPYATFKAADGWFNLGVANDRLWTKLCALLDTPALHEDPRFATNPERAANVDALEAALAPHFVADTVEGWLARFQGAGIPAGPILSVEQALAHPQVAAREMVVSREHPEAGTVRMTGVPIRLSETPGVVGAAAPVLGADTDAVLGELGLSASEVKALRASGALG